MPPTWRDQLLYLLGCLWAVLLGPLVWTYLLLSFLWGLDLVLGVLFG